MIQFVELKRKYLNQVFESFLRFFDTTSIFLWSEEIKKNGVVPNFPVIIMELNISNTIVLRISADIAFIEYVSTAR